VQTQKKAARTVPDIPDALIKSLVEKAKVASKNAYCPYSRFPVGAALLTESGEIFTGCNVENASYGLTICAERNAAFQMVAQGKQPIKAVVIYTPTERSMPPCGACRQVINEFGRDAIIVCSCDGPEMLKRRVSDLLPDAFGLGDAR
jgi:cytidine deaminase